MPARAEDVPRAARAESVCPVPANQQWKPQEQFVWKRVCLGEEANFNVEQGYGGDLDPKGPSGLPEGRVLSSTFLATILLADKYRHALTNRGVRIIGARFTEPVDLQNAELSSDLWLDRSVLEKGADFAGLRSTRRVTLDGSKVTGPLKLSGLELHGGLSLSNAELAAVELASAHVDSLSFVGSQVTGLLNLAELHVDHDLAMYQAKFAEVLLGLAYIQGNLVLANSKVTGELTMVGLRVDGNLVGLKGEFSKVNLGYGEVNGALLFIGATVTGDLDMIGIRVGRDVLLSSMPETDLVASVPESLKGSLDTLGVKADAEPTTLAKARFGRVTLDGGKVQGALSLIGSSLTDDLSMDGIQIGGDVAMTDGEYKSVSLERARIAGALSIGGSKFGGQLDCYASEIRSRFNLGGGAEFLRPITCSFAKMGELDLSGGSFHDKVDLTGTQIDSELMVGSPGAHTQWPDNSALWLRNAKADAIQDLPDAWPAQIDLSGFTYRTLGGRNATPQDAMADRPVSWFVSWLAKQNPYTPAPYEQLATVLRHSGRSGVADEILYAGKERERGTVDFRHRLWMTTIRALIGYGYHIEWALFWVAGFVIAGIAVLRISGEGPRNRMPYGIVYSFDMLLPVIRLRDKHYQIDLHGWARYYFYLHKIMGYVLASFLIAGIAGITK
jgi:hypothetical protein